MQESVTGQTNRLLPNANPRVPEKGEDDAEQSMVYRYRTYSQKFLFISAIISCFSSKLEPKRQKQSLLVSHAIKSNHQDKKVSHIFF